MDRSKKKILLINTFFKVGGIQSSLINMANELCEDYNVELLLYYPEGPLKSRLDSRVSIIQPCWALKALGMSVSEAFRSLNPLIILFKILGSVWAKIFDNRLPVWIASKLQPKLKGYDLAVSFRQEANKKVISSGFVRVLTRCVDAKTKIAWIHYDALKINNDNDFNRKYYAKVDKIVGVSQSVVNSFKTLNPDLSDKMDYCYNFLDYKKLFENSEVEQEVKYPEDKFICFSACRLSEEKGLLRGIYALAPIFKEHNDIFWYIAGDGPERENIEAVIKAENLEDRIILLGNQSNPYPYMKNADLLFSLSFHEAAPMVYMEAKALHVPVFSTETSSSVEMLKDGIEDFICENSEEDIKNEFSVIMKNRERIAEAKNALGNYCANNNESIQKIAEWMK